MEKPTDKYKSTIKNNKYFAPVVTMILSLSIAVGVAVMIKSLMSGDEKITIATNVAEEAFYNRNYDVAISEYSKLQEKDEWPIWTVKNAEVYSVKGDFVKSNELLQNSYEARNKIMDTENKEKFIDQDKELCNYIVFTYLMNGEYKKSLEYGELFLNDYSSDKNLLRTMFTVYMVNNEKDKAKEIVNNYPRENETSADLAILARMNMLIDDFDKGFSLLKDAWYADKNEVKVFDVVAQITAYNKDLILDKISNLEKKNPDEVAYKMWLAKIYSMDEDSIDQAKKIVQEIYGKDDSINLKLIEANIYKNSGESEKSQEILKQIINSEEDSFIGYHTAAWQSYSAGEYDKALKFCKQSILMNKDYADNYGYLIPEIMEKQGKTEEAEPYFRTALYKEPFNYNTIIKIAEYYWNTAQDSSKSLYYYDLASKIKPNDSEIYYNMALIKVNNQRDDEAIELLKNSIKLDGDVSKYYRALGTIYLNQEKNDDAIKAIRNSYSINKNDILTLNNAGCYYISIEGNVERGMTNLKAAYDGINDKTSENDKTIITDNYTKVKELYDAYNKKDGSTLHVPDLKLFY